MMTPREVLNAFEHVKASTNNPLEYKMATDGAEAISNLLGFLDRMAATSCADCVRTKVEEELESKKKFIDHIFSLPNCHTCLELDDCPGGPVWGSDIRYNCMAWRGKNDENE